MNTTCPWCGSQKAQIHLWLKDEFLTKEDFLIYECQDCGLRYTEPRPSQKTIGKYYKSEEYYSHQENKKGLIPRLYEKVKGYNLKKKYKIAAKDLQKGTVLDIGCGVGDFLHTMENRGWKGTGIEPSEEAKDIARNRVNANLLEPREIVDLESESFDLITMWHVLEHVDDFRKALREMYRILRPGGSFICSFPMDPKIELLDEDPAIQTEEERIRRFGQDDHKRVFGMKADRFLTEAGFEVERIDGKDYPKEILPVVGPADYDMNLLFRCIKNERGITA